MPLTPNKNLDERTSPVTDFIAPEDIVDNSLSGRFSTFKKSMRTFFHSGQDNSPTINNEMKPMPKHFQEKRPNKISINLENKDTQSEPNSLQDYTPIDYHKEEPLVLSGPAEKTPSINTVAETPNQKSDDSPLTETKTYSPAAPTIQLPRYNSPPLPEPEHLETAYVALPSATDPETESTCSLKNAAKNFSAGGVFGAGVVSLYFFAATGAFSIPAALTSCCLCGTATACCCKKKNNETTAAPADQRMV